MMSNSVCKFSVFLFLICGLFACGGGGSPVAYYTINPMVEADGAVAPAPSAQRVIGVMPVKLPGIIDRAQMVRRKGDYRVERSSVHRWADLPDKLVQQVVADNLEQLVPGVRVILGPWPASAKPDVTVSLRFDELMGGRDRIFYLDATWTLRTKEKPPKETVGTIRLDEKIEGSGYDDLAAAHSRALAQLCRQLAADLNSL